MMRAMGPPTGLEEAVRLFSAQWDLDGEVPGILSPSPGLFAAETDWKDFAIFKRIDCLYEGISVGECCRGDTMRARGGVALT